MKNTKKIKRNILLVDNPIDILAVIFGLFAIGALFSLRARYAMSDEFPSVATDSVKLIIVGMSGITGLFLTRIIFHTKKGDRVSLIANTTHPDNLLDFGFAIATYFGIQIVVIILNKAVFQVASVDVYLFFFSAAICEEMLYRGFLVMFVQIILIRMLKIKARHESDVLLPNILTCFISGSVFMAVHTVYYGQPAQMIITFVGGFFQAFWYLKSKNLFVPMISHASINFVASGSLLQTLNG
ncbi:MAG: CPBP family intramembrane glutamic endopeptidase [Promethearchaeota archaeon]